MIDKISGDLGGTENQLIKLINGLDKSEFKKHLICFDETDWFQKNCSRFQCDTGVMRINKLAGVHTYVNFVKLVRFIRYYKPDIVHTFFPVGNSLGVLAAHIAGADNILSSRRDYGEWMNRRYLFATRLANRFVKKILVNANSVKELTETSEKVRNGKVEVIYNGIDVKMFNKIQKNLALKETLHIPREDKVIGIIANFRPMKHHETFIKAAKEILTARKDVSFVLIGAGKRKDGLLSLSESLKVGHKMHFTGPQPDVRPYLSFMDVGVNCSEREGLSNAIMEYMAAGVPCVVSRAGGNPDLIIHDVNGYEFELDDHSTLAELVLKLLADEETRQKFIKNSRDRIQNEMSLDRMISNYGTLYKNLVNSKLNHGI